MKRSLTEDELHYMVERMIDNINSAITDAEKNADDFYRGRRFAYYEMLDTIKNELYAHGQDLKDYGLDINLERTLLTNSSNYK